MQFGVLGPLLVQRADGPLTIGSAKQRALLAVLLLETPHNLVPAERLIDELWGENPPAGADKALRVHVSQLRRILGAEQPIITVPRGYALQIDPPALDLHRFNALLGSARHARDAGNPDEALRALQEGLGLWRGPALGDVTLLGPAANEASRLDGLRVVADEERIELELANGNSAALVHELEALIARDPYREHLHALLMLALYRAGRQADALEAYWRARKQLVEELGLEPGPELVRLETAILAQDPALDLPEAIMAPAPGDSGPTHVATGVPRPAASILGRDAELDAALALIERPDVGLVTLTGPGGIGKTRLALEIALRIGERACLVELAAIAQAERVLPVIGAAVGAEGGSEDAVAAALRRQPIVLFLDNFEQVLEAAPLITSLLAGVASLKVVVTSRTPLNVAGEHEVPVPPLALNAAAQLFVQRVRERDPDFSPDANELDCIGTICQRIDRLPLAIELAAARAQVLTPKEILDRLGRRLDLLTAGRRDAPDRHRTLRATIDWSYELLEPPAQRLFAQLAVFRSGCSFDGCEAVAGAAALESLGAVVDHGLAIREDSRFGMLETVREYAADRLEELPDAEATRRRHAIWCLTLAKAAEQELEGPEQATWLARLDLERENLRAAAAWALANGEPEITLELDATLWRFWLARVAVAEALERLTAALASGRGSASVRAKALNAAGVLAGEANDFTAARVSFEEALELAVQLDDRRQTARILMNLGVIAAFTEDYEVAVARYSDAGGIWQQLGDVRGQGVMCQNVAVVYELMGQFEQARPLLEQSVALARAAGDGMFVAQTLIEFGKHLVRFRPRDPRIPSLLREALELSTTLGEQRQIIECLEVLAALSAYSGASDTGAELIGAADAQRSQAAIERKPDQLPFFDATIRELERALGRDGYERAHDQGRGRTLQDATAIALESLGSELGG
jgi:predicted ATPase/DNA-binding SARP family transcriptional activator